MAIIHIEYRLPTIVVVDTDTKRVERVVVDDEAISSNEPVGFWLEHSSERATKAQQEEAIDIVDNGEHEWPTWEWGW